MLAVPPALLWTCALGCGVLLAAERLGSRPWVWIGKMAAASAYLAAALALGALDTGYGRWVLLALGCCWLGDLLLIPAGRPRLFLLGIAAFFLGHVAFAAAFLARGVSWPVTAAGAGVAAVAGWLLLRWLRPHLEGLFAAAVPAYAVAIAAMVALATGASTAGGSAGVAAGAWAFAVSDVSVARERFVAPGFANGAWGLPLYFLAQLILAASVAS